MIYLVFVMMMIYLILSHTICLVRATKHHLNLARLTRCKQPNMSLLHALNQTALSCHFLTWYHSLGLVWISIRTFLLQCSLWPSASMHHHPCTVRRTPAHALSSVAFEHCLPSRGLSAFSSVKKKKEKIEKRQRVGTVPWCSVAFNGTN